MPNTTAEYGIVYPLGAEPANGAGNMKALAESVEAALDTTGTFVTYTPSWTASTPPAIGNGTIEGKYRQTNKLTFFRVVITMGSTTTYGSGSYSVTLPADTAVNHQIVTGLLFDTSASAFYPLFGIRNSASSMALVTDPTTAGNAFRVVNATVPFTFATGDKIIISGVYEAA